jgi:hypothetical protein
MENLPMSFSVEQYDLRFFVALFANYYGTWIQL